LSFPEDDPGSFEERAREGTKKFEMVELSFFHYSGNPEEADRYESMISFAANVIGETRLKVGSLHLPNTNILSRSRARKLINSFLPFCTEIDCKSIVVHPGSLVVGLTSEADNDYARTSLREILQESSRELEESKVTLSIETYPGKNRVPSGTPDLSRFISDLPPVYRIAYDTSHTIGDTDSVIEEVLANIEKIGVFHFSNRCRDERHMPIFSLKGALNFPRIIDAIKASRFNGLIILEYQPKKYRMLLERDLKLLKDMIDKP
jgi:sugar phosphate isomerase/epimerase